MTEYEPRTIIVTDEGLTFSNVKVICGLSQPAYIRFIKPVLREGELIVIDGKVPGRQVLEIYQVSERLRQIKTNKGGLPPRRRPINVIFELSEI